MSRVIIFDIETEPKEELIEFVQGNIKAPANYKDEKKIAEYIAEKKLDVNKKMATDTDYARVKFVGVKELGEEAEIMSIKQFMDLLQSDVSYTLVSFNGKQFDVPIIIKEGIRLGIKIESNLFNCMKRFDNTWHIDMMEVLSFGQRDNVKSLDNYARIYLGKEKKPIDFATCSDDELKEHCKEDLSLTEELYLKFKDLI